MSTKEDSSPKDGASLEDVQEEDPKKRKKRKKGGCLRKLFLLTLIGLPILGFLINGPIFRWAVGYGIEAGAATIGLEGEVTVHGTILSGLELEEAEFKGDGTGPVSSLSLGEAKVEYSLMDLIKSGGLIWIKELRLKDADVALVLTETTEEELEEEEPSDLSILWQLAEIRYAIENINLTISKGESQYVVDNFTLLIPSGGKGTLSIERLEVPGIKPQEAISTEIEVSQQFVTLGPLRILDPVEVTSFTLNRDTAENKPLLATVLELSGGTIEAEYSNQNVTAELTEGSISLPELATLVQLDDLKTGSVTRLKAGLTPDPSVADSWKSTIDLELEGTKWSDMANLGRGNVSVDFSGNFAEADSWKTALDLTLEEASWQDQAKIGKAILFTDFEGSFISLDNWNTTIDVTLEEAHWQETAEVKKAELSVDFSGSPLTPSSWDTETTLTVTSGTYGPTQLDEAKLEAWLNPGDGEDETLKLHIARSESTVDATAKVDLSTTDILTKLADLPLSVEADLDIAKIEEFLAAYLPDGGKAVPATGAFAGDLNVKIAERKLVSTHADLSSTTLAYDGVQIEKVELKADMEGLQTVAVDGEITLDASTGIKLDGDLDTKTLAYSAKADGSAAVEGKLKSLLQKLGIEKNLSATATFDWSGSGSLTEGEHQGSIELDGNNIRYGEVDPIDVVVKGNYRNADIDLSHLEVKNEQLEFEGALKYAANYLDISKLTLRSGELTLLEGYLRTPLDPEFLSPPARYFAQDGTVDIDIESYDLKLSSVLNLFQFTAPTDFNVGLTLKASGTPADLNLEAGLVADDIDLKRDDRIEPARTELELSVDQGVVSLSGKLEQPQIQPFSLTGKMAFYPAEWIDGKRDPLNESFSLEAGMKESHLGFLAGFIPGIEEIDGSIDVDVSLSGTLGNPNITGKGDMRVDTLRLAARGAPSVREVAASLRFEDRALHIDELKAVVAGGTIGLKGNVGFPKEAEPQLDLRLGGHEVLVYRNDSLSLRTNLNLALAGPVNTANLSGTIGITSSLFYKDFDILPIGGFARGGGKSSVPEVEPGPAVPLPQSLDIGVPIKPFSDWGVDVRIITQDPFHVSGNLARAQIHSDLKLTGTLGAPIPNGRIWIENGVAILPFTRMGLSEAQIEFDENTGFNGNLGIRANAETGDYRISIFAHNRLLAPELAFTSIPPLPREDIISLIASGVTRSELTDGGNVAATKAALLWFKSLSKKKSKIDPDAPPTFVETLEERTDVSVGAVDAESGELGINASFRLWKESYLAFSVGKHGSQRGVLKYIFRFR